LEPHSNQRRAALPKLHAQPQLGIAALGQQVGEEVPRHPQAQRLLTQPGVGPVTALAMEGRQHS
jgi:transposase